MAAFKTQLLAAEAKITELEGHIARHRRGQLDAEAHAEELRARLHTSESALIKAEDEVTARGHLVDHLFAVIGCLHRYFER